MPSCSCSSHLLSHLFRLSCSSCLLSHLSRLSSCSSRLLSRLSRRTATRYQPLESHFRRPRELSCVLEYVCYQDNVEIQVRPAATVPLCTAVYRFVCRVPL